MPRTRLTQLRFWTSPRQSHSPERATTQRGLVRVILVRLQQTRLWRVIFQARPPNRVVSETHAFQWAQPRFAVPVRSTNARPLPANAGAAINSTRRNDRASLFVAPCRHAPGRSNVTGAPTGLPLTRDRGATGASTTPEGCAMPTSPWPRASACPGDGAGRESGCSGRSGRSRSRSGLSSRSSSLRSWGRGTTPTFLGCAALVASPTISNIRSHVNDLRRRGYPTCILPSGLGGWAHSEPFGARTGSPGARVPQADSGEVVDQPLRGRPNGDVDPRRHAEAPRIVCCAFTLPPLLPIEHSAECAPE